ncbi:MAG: CHAD domain-containing protein [Planctomycetaceae bacterium]
MDSHRKPVARLERLIRANAHEQARRARSLLAAAMPPDAMSIHETRKTIKRLRATLSLLQHELGDDYKSWMNRLGALNRRLSSVRDLDACLKILADLRSSGSLSRQFVINQLQAELADQRTLCAAAGGSDWRKSLVDELDGVMAGFSVWQASAKDFDLIESALRKLARRARRLIRDLQANPRVEGIHSLRKLVKRRLYWLEMLEPLWPRGFRAEKKLVDVLADHLGDHHDLAVLLELLGKSAAAQQSANTRTVQSLERRLIFQQKQLERRALRSARYLFAERPKAFAQRWKAVWKVWRDLPLAVDTVSSPEQFSRPRPR